MIKNSLPPYSSPSPFRSAASARSLSRGFYSIKRIKVAFRSENLLFEETDVGSVIERAVAFQEPFGGFELPDVERVVGQMFCKK